MIMKRKLPERKAQTFRQKKWKKEKSNYLKALPALLQHQKHLNVKKTSSFAMHVDNKRKQIDAWSHKITEKAIMGILFEAEIGTTYVTSAQRQHFISMRSAEAALQHLFKGSIQVVHHKLKTSGWICFIMTDCILL